MSRFLSFGAVAGRSLVLWLGALFARKNCVMRWAVGGLLAIALLVARSEAEAFTYRFTNIVEADALSPTGSPFTGFANPAVSDGTVAFEGYYSDGQGIFTGSGGPLTTIVKAGDTGVFGPYGLVTNPSISGDNVAFHGAFADVLQSSGIFVGDGSQVKTIALERDSAPVGTFTIFGNPSISGSDVAFFAAFREPPFDPLSGVFVGSGGTLTTVAKTGDVGPTGEIRPHFLSDPKINDGTVVFTASDETGVTGIYTGSGGPLANVVRWGDPAPVGSILSTGLPTISNGAVEFLGADDGGGYIFLHKDGQVTTILSASDPAPIGTFDAIWEAAVGGSMVAFIANFGGNDAEGIFVSSGGLLTTVVKSGDPLFGGTVERFFTGGIGDFAFDPDGAGSIAFQYTLSDGRFGVALASIVPEPSTLVLIVVAMMSTFVIKRRIMSSTYTPGKMKRFIILSSFLGLSPVLGTATCFGDILFESGTLGPTGLSFGDVSGGTAPGSSGVNADVFSGVRFQLSKPVRTARVGGHFVDDTRTDDTFFGAIVRLDDPMDFPDSGDLSTPDVLGATSLTFPNPSAEVFGNLEIKLDPGWYALVFGGGLFGATGSGAAVLNNPDIGSPTYIAYQTGSGWLELSTLPGPFRDFRLVVEGSVIPEPSSVALTLLALYSISSLRSIKRKHLRSLRNACR